MPNAQATGLETQRTGASDAAQQQGQAPREDGPLTLRGTSRGLEIWIGSVEQNAQELAKLLKEQLAQSPSFFSGGDAIVHFASTPPQGAISALEDVAQEFSLRLVAVHTASLKRDDAGSNEPAPRLSKRKATRGNSRVATKSAPSKPSKKKDAPSTTAPSYPLPATRYAPAYQAAVEQAASELAEAQTQKAKEAIAPMMIPGPVRSGTCFEAPGHLVVVGDVNPGAEIRAEGNIVVLGSLRGVAHAGMQGQPAFILALKLQPQQLRVGTLIARAGDADNPASGAEIAYAADQMIVVDEYQGRLPHTIANSI